MNDSELDSLLAVSRPVSIKARSTVCRKGEPGDALYIVISGKLKVAAMSEDGREAILAILEDGETFGEMSLLDERPRSANVYDLSDYKYSYTNAAPLRMLTIKDDAIARKIEEMRSKGQGMKVTIYAFAQDVDLNQKIVKSQILKFKITDNNGAEIYSASL